MKVIFYGTSAVGLPALRALAAEFDVVLVVTSPDAPVGRKQVVTPSAVSVLADELGIPTAKPERVRGNVEFLKQLEELSADIAVVVSYGKILPEDVLTTPRLGTVNVHFSLLPKYRGASPLQSAILSGETRTGVTVFKLDAALDHGPIIATWEAGIGPHDTFTTLAERLAEESGSKIVDIVQQYDAGALSPIEQNHGEATHCSVFTKADGRVRWADSAESIYNRYRALETWPGLWTTYEGKNFKVLGCAPAAFVSAEAPGTVLAGGAVACGLGTVLQLTEVQPEGKTKVSVGDFLNGHRDFVGKKLE